MRTVNSIKNMIASICSNGITILLGFVVQRVFIRTLGTEYLGINGLFSNIVSMLGIVELGMGSAIIYNMYEPIVNNNVEKIKSLMKFYKIGYRIIACIVFVIGLMIIPFLNILVGNVSISDNITLIYMFFIIDVTCSYLLSYKRSILYANQKNYYVQVVHIVCLTLMDVFQIVILYLTKNFYLFLIIKVIMRLLENIVITFIANNKYKYLNEPCADLDKETRDDIFHKIKALFFHKIGVFIVTGTDSILISLYFGVVTVGLYSSYKMVLSAVTTLIGQVFSSLNASVGNLLVYKDTQKNYLVFRKIHFLNFWLSTFATVGVLVSMDSLIIIWVGKSYILPVFVLISLCLNNYWQTMRGCIATFKEAAGVFYEDRFVPIFESLCNLVFSIIFLKMFGLAGIFLGTLVSNFVLYLYSYPKFVYCKLFDRSYKQYIFEIFGYFFVAFLIACFTYFIASFIVVPNIFLKFVINIIVCIIVPNAILVLIFFKTDEFKYYIDLLKKIFSRKERR